MRALAVLLALVSASAGAKEKPLPEWVVKGSGVYGDNLMGVGMGETQLDALAHALAELVTVQQTMAGLGEESSVRSDDPEIANSMKTFFEGKFGKVKVTRLRKVYEESGSAIISESVKVSMGEGEKAITLTTWSEAVTPEGGKTKESLHTELVATNLRLANLLAELARAGLKIENHAASDGAFVMVMRRK